MNFEKGFSLSALTKKIKKTDPFTEIGAENTRTSEKEKIVSITNGKIWLRDGRGEIIKAQGHKANIYREISIAHGNKDNVAYGLNDEHAKSRFEHGWIGENYTYQQLLDDETSPLPPRTEWQKKQKIAGVLNKLIAVSPKNKNN